MMRKLIVLMLVLGIASVASAGTAWLEVDSSDFQASGNYDISVAITINVVADGAVPVLSVGAIGSDTTMGGASAPLALHASYTQVPINPGTILNSGDILIEFIGGTVPFGGTNPAAGAALYSFEYTGTVLGAVTIDDVTDMTITPPYMTSLQFDDWTFATDLGALSLNIIPEPMTIALLGLGGLVLLRRRK